MTDSVSQSSARCHVFLARAEVSITPFATGCPVGHIGIHHTGSVPNYTIVYHPITAPSHNLVGAIVGGVIGGVAGVALLALVPFLFWRRRQRLRAERARAEDLSPYSAPDTTETSTVGGSAFVSSPRKGQMAADNAPSGTAFTAAPMSSTSASASAGIQSRGQGSSSGQAPAEELNELRREMGTLRQYIEEINAAPPSYRED